MFAFPTEMDNSPYSVLEAMRAGVPVVATRVGALPEMVEDGVTGLLVAHDDVDARPAIGVAARRPGRGLTAMGAAGRSPLRGASTTPGSRPAQLLDVLTEARERFSRGPA